jgi:hypothetical protein
VALVSPLNSIASPKRFPRRLFEQLPAFLSVFFLIFVLSPAREAVMFTNRSNYLSGAKQRQLGIFRRNKTNKRAGN